MTKTKKPRVLMALPLAVARYTHLSEPDTKGQYADNKYKLTLVWDDGVDLAALDDAVDKVATEMWGEDVDLDAIKRPYKLAEDQTKDDFEGKVTMTPKSQHKPDLVDTKRKPLPADVHIMGGDLVKAVVSVSPYETTEKVRNGRKTETAIVRGVTGYLNVVQLVDKRGGGKGLDLLDDIEGYEGSESAADQLGDADY